MDDRLEAFGDSGLDLNDLRGGIRIILPGISMNQGPIVRMTRHWRSIA